MTDRERWAQIETLFHAAMDMDERVRTEWLRVRCGKDTDLFGEVSSLLRHEMPAEEEIRHLIQDAAARIEQQPAEDFRAGDYIGPYHLIKEIGQGGMGVVYLAARTDPQFFQTVAIKVLRRELGGSALVSRFLRERQILATLSHPNIAHVLDGGNTEDGTPYLVMEFISGKPITVYAAEKRLSVEQRIRLFQRVCDAVQHAHRNLVIHRDLKPGNVLVADNGEPKLLDFGIAKLLGPEMLPLELPPTETQYRPMTPDYASPEQLQGKVLTTATDVFSLGVLLYEMLAGQRPFRFQTSDPMEWMEMVCSRDPAPPSSSERLGPRERKEVGGDLDQIVMKALSKDPARRYGSAQQLAEDLERYLKGEPVLAHRNSLLYRGGKWMQRHRLMLAMASLLCVALMAGMLTTIWQTQRAERRFNELRSFAYAVVFDLDDKIRALPGSTEARGALIRTSLQYLDNLSREAGGDAELMTELSRAYRKIGDVQGSPFQPNLGDTEAAKQSYRKALELAREAARNSPKSFDAQLELAESEFAMGRILAHSGGLSEAAALYHSGRSSVEKLAREHAYDPKVTELRSRGAMYLGDVQMLASNPEEALDSYRFSVRVLEASDVTQPATTREIARAYARLADAKAATGELRQAVTHYERSIELRETLARRFPEEEDYQRDLFNAYISIGSLLGGHRSLSLHNREAARPWFLKASVIAENLLSDDPGSTRTRVDAAFSRAHLAESLPDHQLEDAVYMMRDSVRLFDEIVAAAPANVGYRQWQARRYEGLSRLLRRQGKHAEALAAMRRSLEIRREVLADDPARADLRTELSASACGVADLMAAMQHPDLAEALATAQRLLQPLEEGKATLASATQCAECYESFARASLLLGDGRETAWRQKAANAWNLWQERGVATPYTMARLRQLGQ